MENASKALIIAGAILISILIIAIGMYIYTNSQASITNATSQMSTQEKAAFNQTWTTYEGQQSGSNCKTLIAQILSSNTTNINEEDKLIDLEYQAKKDGETETVEPVVDDTKATEMSKAKNAIDNRHTYTVTTDLDGKTGLINKITITY